jgi:hypothetical protein
VARRRAWIGPAVVLSAGLLAGSAAAGPSKDEKVDPPRVPAGAVRLDYGFFPKVLGGRPWVAHAKAQANTTCTTVSMLGYAMRCYPETQPGGEGRVWMVLERRGTPVVKYNLVLAMARAPVARIRASFAGKVVVTEWVDRLSRAQARKANWPPGVSFAVFAIPKSKALQTLRGYSEKGRLVARQEIEPPGPVPPPG